MTIIYKLNYLNEKKQKRKFIYPLKISLYLNLKYNLTLKSNQKF